MNEVDPFNFPLRIYIFPTKGSGDISKVGIQDTSMAKVKSQLQPLTAKSEATVILSVDTKTEDRNSMCKRGSSTSNNSVI